jgi:predicted glycosyl hydrolase (DUF1957 family)
LDVTQPYLVELPNHREISVFFYDQGLSTGISFDPGSTQNADWFVRNNLQGMFTNDERDQFLLIASDGELYGHHQPFREKFLSYLLDGALHQAGLDFSTPGMWLKEHPATQKLKIRENSSWSCFHGVERWQGKCDCTPNGIWKKVMRDFLNLVADKVDQIYLSETEQILQDCWESRNQYIDVILNVVDYKEWEQNQIRVDSLVLSNPKASGCY